jgi:Fe-coproporphyrin III synthase
MIRITQFLHGAGTVSEVIKYRKHAPHGVPSRLVAFTETRRPVIFWNITKQCNLACTHCYIDAGPEGGEELPLEDAMGFIADLADMRIPLLMFTGGEPLVKKDFWQLAEFAKEMGLNTALSTNGTLISKEVAAKIKAVGIEYVGVSLDGAKEETHDAIRNQPGSFQKALLGLQNCADTGIRAGIRVTITRDNYHEVAKMIDLTHELRIPRFCAYWLVPSGRGREMYEKQVEPDEAFQIFETLFRKAKLLNNEEMEILTVDAPQDGIYLLNILKEAGSPEYDSALKLLKFMGHSCSAGDRVASVDPAGNVYPCQFMQREEFCLGNVRKRKFSEIWTDSNNTLLSAFRKKTSLLKGKCASCVHKEVCGGGCRVRAYAQNGDLWADDPLCILI